MVFKLSRISWRKLGDEADGESEIEWNQELEVQCAGGGCAPDHGGGGQKCRQCHPFIRDRTLCMKRDLPHRAD